MINKFSQIRSRKIMSLLILILVIVFFYFYPYRNSIYTCDFQVSEEDEYADLLFDNPRSFILKKYLFNKYSFEVSTLNNNVISYTQCEIDDDTVVNCVRDSKYSKDYKRIKFNTINQLLQESHIEINKNGEYVKSTNYNFACSRSNNS